MNSNNSTIIKMIDNLKPPSNTLYPRRTLNSNEIIEIAHNDSTFEESLPLKRSGTGLLSNSFNGSVDEFNETPNSSKKRKFDSSLDVSYIASPREARRLRTDLVEARNNILILENRITELHSFSKEMQILFDNERQTLKRNLDLSRKSVTELENQLQIIKKREREFRQELSDVKNNYSVLKIQSDQKIEELEKKLNQHMLDDKENESHENAEISSLKRKINQLENIVRAAEEDTESHKKLAAELQQELKEKNVNSSALDLKDQEIQKLKLIIKDYDYVKENYLEYQEKAKTQAYKLARYIEMEKENESLKLENERIKGEIRNKLILEEENNDLKERLIRYKEQESKLSAAQMQLIQTELNLNEWKAVARGILEITGSDTPLPHLLRAAVERLQQQELILTEESINLKSKLDTALHEAKVAKDELKKNQVLLSRMTASDERKKNLIHRIQKKLLLISRERDSYRLQLSSYEKDLTMSLNTSLSGSNHVQSMKDRIENLEQVVSDYREMVAKLEDDLKATENDTSAIAPIKLDQITRYQEEINQLKIENERIKNLKDQLEIKFEKILDNGMKSSSGPVYHAVNNPYSQCLAERERFIEKLQEEVDRLKKKVKQMEAGLESSRLADISMSTQEVQTLKKELENRENQMQMLKDHFKSSMTEFRDAVYILLGYKIDKNPKSLYKLSNIYADNPNDCLCFQSGADGEMSLLENSYTDTLGSLIDLHLSHQNSIPNFLSALTLNLYFSNRTTTETIQIDRD